MRPVFFLLLILSCCACENFAGQELTELNNDYAPELVLFSLPNPQDSLLVVDLRRSISSLGGRPDGQGFRQQIPDATVSISDGSVDYPLRFADFDPVSGYYLRLDSLDRALLRPGESYVISAEYAGERVQAEFAIPLDSLPVDAAAFAFETETLNGFTDLWLNASIPNLPGDDFYLVTVNRDTRPASGRRREEIADFLRGRDELGDSLYLARIELFEFNTTTVRICAIDPLAFEYLDARATAIANQENIFAEPTLLPTNVENGRGFVGGLNCQAYVFVR
jgi:hypothetical protein